MIVSWSQLQRSYLELSVHGVMTAGNPKQHDLADHTKRSCQTYSSLKAPKPALYSHRYIAAAELLSGGLMQAQHFHCQTQTLHRTHKPLLQLPPQQLQQSQPCTKLPSRCKVCGRKTTPVSLRGQAAAEAAVADAPLQTTDFQTGFPSSKAWELDFSSRPVFDERGKKRWELLLCSPDGSWRFAQYFPNNKITSGQVRCVLAAIADDA